jgi:hypothetical protein
VPEEHPATIGRPAFLFRAQVRLPGEATPDRRSRHAGGSRDGAASRWLLLAPRANSLHYALYSIELPTLAENLATGVVAIQEFIMCLGSQEPPRTRLPQPCAQVAACRCHAVVLDGAFFSLDGTKRYVLRVIEGAPLIYLNGNHREMLIEAPQDVVSLDTGLGLAIETYTRVRERIRRMRVSLSARARDRNPPQRPRPPTGSGNPEQRLEPRFGMRPGVPRPPAGPPPKGRFASGRPISHPPYELPNPKAGLASPAGSRDSGRNGYTLRMETSEYMGVDEYVVRNLDGVILGRFQTRTEAEIFIGRLREGSG